jgi:3-oxoacyl-[acyl-carrier protein] reductase
MDTRTALITGASRGIGRTIALRLAEAGFTIRAHGRDEQALDETCRLVHDTGGSAHAFPADLTDTAAIERLAEWATTDGCDVVVHNAGIGGSGRVAEADFARWDRILDVDLRAPMRLTALTLQHVAKRSGAYVFIGSISAKMGMAGSGAYCAAKHGIDGFAEALFEEVREDGVRVVRIHPGYVNTEMVGGRALDTTKMIQSEDVAALVQAAVELPPTACVVEMVVRPQRTPYV